MKQYNLKLHVTIGAMTTTYIDVNRQSARDAYDVYERQSYSNECKTKKSMLMYENDRFI